MNGLSARGFEFAVGIVLSPHAILDHTRIRPRHHKLNMKRNHIFPNHFKAKIERQKSFQVENSAKSTTLANVSILVAVIVIAVVIVVVVNVFIAAPPPSHAHFNYL